MPTDGRLRAWIEVQDDAVLAAFVAVPGVADSAAADHPPRRSVPRQRTPGSGSKTRQGHLACGGVGGQGTSIGEQYRSIISGGTDITPDRRLVANPRLS